MAYDPKTYLQQALKSGFQDIYAPASNIDDSPRYEGSEARFGDVVVRPLTELVGQTEQDIGTPQEVGHAVSVPLTGKYEGYFRNDIYDNQGNFLRTTISEPDKDKYGLKSLAQLGLTAASLGGLGPVASTVAKGIGALQSKNPLALLSAVTGLPGADKILPTMPSAVSDVLKYAGQAKDISQALKGDPNAIFRTIVGADKAFGAPSGKAASAGYGGADPGYFDPDAETAPLPDWALDPYKDDITTQFTPGSDEVYEDIESLLARYENQGFADTPSSDLSQSIEVTGRRDNLDIDPWLQPFVDPEPRMFTVSEGKPEQIEVTGKRQPTPDVSIPDWDILPDVYTPRSIRDVGNVTKVSPDEPLDGTKIIEPDLSVGLTPAVVSPAPKPATPGKAPTPSPAPKAADKGMDLSALFALLGAMGGQQPTQAPSPYQTARIDTESPFGLMYGMRG